MKEKITPRDIAQKLDIKDVKKSFKYFYGKTDYVEEVFKRISEVPKRKPEIKDEYIVIRHWDTFTDISYYGIATNKYSLSLRKWNEVANIPIDNEMFNRYSLAEIMALLIYEITFYGDEERMRKLKKELYKSAREIKNKLK